MTRLSIRTLEIGNFKSIDSLHIQGLSPFSVFAGANASGKSNFVADRFDFRIVCEFVDQQGRESVFDYSLRVHRLYEQPEPEEFLNVNGDRVITRKIGNGWTRQQGKTEIQGFPSVWLTTHSESVVRALELSELVLVDKVDGRTTMKRADAGNLKQHDLAPLTVDEAWLTTFWTAAFRGNRRVRGRRGIFETRPELPTNTCWDRLKEISRMRNQRGPGRNRLVFARKMIGRYQFDINRAARHPHCPSARYFIDRLKVLATK